jgi:FHA domain
MDLFCRNPKCEYSSRPIPGRGNSIKCPSCGHPLLGGSVIAPRSTDLPPADIRDRVHDTHEKVPFAKPPADPKPVEKAEKVPSISTPERPPIKQPSKKHRPKVDDGNVTRPFDGPLPVLGHQSRFLVELIENGRVNPVTLIDESGDTPLYSQDAGKRHLATMRSTSEGVELTPLDADSRFFVQIRSPIRMATGSRFRIGDFVIEARLQTSTASLTPAVQRGQADAPQELLANGEIVFLRADGSDGLRFPILRNIVIGRGGPGDPHVDIPLLAANVSRKHAAVGLGTHGLKLKNLSRHGTFVESRRPTLLVEGDRFRLGESLWQLVRYPRPS